MNTQAIITIIMPLILHSYLKIDKPIEHLYIDDDNCLREENDDSTILIKFLNVP